MPDRVDLIVRNGTVVTTGGQYEADLAIANGRFVAIGAPGQPRLEADEVYDASGQHVLPGVIDGHVHFREPGLEYKEDFRTGSRAAVMGGVTTVLDMPNTLPPTATLEVVRLKQELAESKSYCDFGFIGVFVNENVDQLGAMAEAGVVGFKCFLGETIGNLPAPDDGVMLDGMRAIRELGLRLGFHAENNQIMQHLIRQAKAAGRSYPLAHLESRPTIAEIESIQRMALFAHHSGAKIHIFHLSSADGLATIQAWRRKGVDITCETAAHYVFLTAEDMSRLGSRLRINPPVREPGHGGPLLEGLRTGAVTSIATDHSPHTREEKLNDDIWQALSGFVGVEISVPLFLTCAVNAGKMTLQQYVRASSEGPAKAWGLYPQKGAIQLGSDADLTIVDLNKEGVVDENRLHSKNNVTPFHGQRTKGAPVATIVRGQVVMRDGELVGQPRGRMARPRRPIHARQVGEAHQTSGRSPLSS